MCLGCPKCFVIKFTFYLTNFYLHVHIFNQLIFILLYMHKSVPILPTHVYLCKMCSARKHASLLSLTNSCIKSVPFDQLIPKICPRLTNSQITRRWHCCTRFCVMKSFSADSRCAAAPTGPTVSFPPPSSISPTEHG